MIFFDKYKAEFATQQFRKRGRRAQFHLQFGKNCWYYLVTFK